MRVTTSMAVGTLVNNLDRSYERIARFQNELSSGTRLNTLSDDPAAIERSLGLRAELRNIEQFQKNIDDGTGWLELSEASLNELETLFVEVRGLAVQGSTSTYNASQRNAIGDQIDQALEHALTLSEGRYRGRYIFAGTRTSDAPYQAVRDQDGHILSVAASGDSSGVIEREVSDGTIVQVNVTGDQLFEDPQQIVIPLGNLPDQVGGLEADQLRSLFGADEKMTLAEIEQLLDNPPPEPVSNPSMDRILNGLREQYGSRRTNPFDVLIELRDALYDDDPEGVRDTLDKLAETRERISSVRGLVGARVNRMEITRNVLDRVAVEMSAILSENEDVDLASTIVNLSQEQDVFQAALASGNTLIPQSLMDFI